MLITPATLSNRLHVKQRTWSERPTFSPFAVPPFRRTFGGEQATLKNIERMRKSERIRRSFFSSFFFFFVLRAPCMQIAVFAEECHARARTRVCLVQLYVRSLMRMAGRYYRYKASYKRFYYPVAVGKALTINNLFASLFVNYTIRHSPCYSDLLSDTHCRETMVLKHITHL